MKITPNNNSLLDLIKGARAGKIVLPQFQRNFVWSRDDITALLISILEGHFIGSFLLLRTDANSIPFAMRELEGIDIRKQDLHPDHMILDGQQRLTSLHYVFAAPEIPLRYTKYPYRFFLNLQKIAEGDIDNAVWSERSDLVLEWMEPEKQYQEFVIPFAEIEAWSSWLSGFKVWLRNRIGENVQEYWKYEDQYIKPWTEAISRITSFPVPTLDIEKIDPDDPIEIAQVCAIFEKMNSTGVPLSVYDLLTARMYRYEIDMHRMWKETVAEHSLLNTYSDGKPDRYGVYLLRTIALLRGLDAKSKTIINLSPKDFESDWKIAAKFTEQALQRMVSTNDDGFGVINPKWMPYSTMISPMAAFLAQISQNHYGHHARKLLRKWYWASALLERYAGSVESVIYRDYQDLLDAFKGVADAKPVVFSEVETRILNNPKYSILDESRVNAVYRVVMCLIALKGAKDFAADDSIEFYALDDHHIFPRAYLAKQQQGDGSKISSDRVNSIVNRTLISSDTNRRISRQSPASYLKKLVPNERRTDIMASHFIYGDALQAMMNNDFETFLHAREKALIDEILRQLSVI